jgi:hypothetical protein
MWFRVFYFFAIFSFRYKKIARYTLYSGLGNKISNQLEEIKGEGGRVKELAKILEYKAKPTGKAETNPSPSKQKEPSKE